MLFLTYVNALTIHDTIGKIERVLKRSILFDITLNNHGKRSNIIFEAVEREADELIKKLRLVLYTKFEAGNFWKEYVVRRIFNILLVEDDPDDKEIFLEAMSIVDIRHSVVTRRDGIEAMEYLNDPDTKLPDVIFLDLNMPRMSGMETLSELKGNEAFRKIPIFICSTSTYINDQIETKRMGIHRYIVKAQSLMSFVADLKEALHGDNNGLV